jgi:hypothetical protein
MDAIKAYIETALRIAEIQYNVINKDEALTKSRLWAIIVALKDALSNIK